MRLGLQTLAASFHFRRHPPSALAQKRPVNFRPIYDLSSVKAGNSRKGHSGVRDRTPFSGNKILPITFSLLVFYPLHAEPP
jgi:hypothetical protein